MFHISTQGATRSFAERTLQPIVSLRRVCDNIARGTLDDEIAVDQVAEASVETYLLMVTFQSFIVALRIGGNAYFGSDINKVIYAPIISATAPTHSVNHASDADPW